MRWYKTKDVYLRSRSRARTTRVRAVTLRLFIWYNVNATLIVGRFQSRRDKTTPQGFRREVEIDFDGLLG